MRWHIIEGEAGCEFAVAQGCTAVVVDSLRASATAAMLLDAGAASIHAVRDVEEALRAKAGCPEALLYGERGGVPPAGFDFGNSPREAHHADGKKVIFTTTTGAGRLVSAIGAPAILMGTTVNASAVARYSAGLGHDVVLIPAGLTGDPDFDAQEDRCAAVSIAMKAGGEIGEGLELFNDWRERITTRGYAALFGEAPHAAKLRAIGMEEDVAYCAQVDLTDAVPVVRESLDEGVLMVAGRS
jgi:2-phosphosulfolactate phosphatase